MDRRRFLGTTLGIFAGSSINWIARLANQKPIRQPDNIWADYSTALVVEDGKYIQGPGVADWDGGGFVMAPVVITKNKLVVHGLKMFYRDVCISHNVRFDGGSVDCNNSDTLQIRYSTHLVLNNPFSASAKVLTPMSPEWPKEIQRYYQENRPRPIGV